MSLDKLNVNAVYHGKPQMFECRRKDFLLEISKRFNLDENEIEIYELSKNCKTRVLVDNLKKVTKVEIMKKTSPTVINGQRPSSSDNKTDMESNIISKLTQNKTLSGKERIFIIDLIGKISENKSLKQNCVNENEVEKSFKTKKVQVKPLTSDSEIQTDPVELEELTAAYHGKKRKNDQIESQIKRMAKMNDGQIDKAEVRRLLADTYDSRRHFILHELPLVQHVKEKYPLLFKLDEVKNELERVCHHGVCDDFLKNIEKFAVAILECTPSTDPLLDKTKKRMDKCQTDIQKNYARNVGSILLLSNLVNEERKYIKLLDKDIDPGDFPYIDASTFKMSELFFDSAVFEIKVEGTLLCEAFTFQEAILCLVAAFYIFNISYPDENFNTYVAFEKLYLESTETIDIDDSLQQTLKYLKLKQQSLENKS